MVLKILILMIRKQLYLTLTDIPQWVRLDPEVMTMEGYSQSFKAWRLIIRDSLMS